MSNRLSKPLRQRGDPGFPPLGAWAARRWGSKVTASQRSTVEKL